MTFFENGCERSLRAKNKDVPRAPKYVPGASLLCSKCFSVIMCTWKRCKICIRKINLMYIYLCTCGELPTKSCLCLLMEIWYVDMF